MTMTTSFWGRGIWNCLGLAWLLCVVYRCLSLSLSLSLPVCLSRLLQLQVFHRFSTISDVQKKLVTFRCTVECFVNSIFFFFHFCFCFCCCCFCRLMQMQNAWDDANPLWNWSAVGKKFFGERKVIWYEILRDTYIHTYIHMLNVYCL